MCEASPAYSAFAIGKDTPNEPVVAAQSGEGFTLENSYLSVKFPAVATSLAFVTNRRIEKCWRPVKLATNSGTIKTAR